MSVDGFAFAEKVDWSIRFHWPWIPGNRSHTNPTQSFEGAQAKRRRRRRRMSVPSSVLSLMANPEISGHALQVERRKDDAMTGLGSLGTSMGLHSSEFCGIPCCWPWHPSLCYLLGIWKYLLHRPLPTCRHSFTYFLATTSAEEQEYIRQEPNWIRSMMLMMMVVHRDKCVLGPGHQPTNQPTVALGLEVGERDTHRTLLLAIFSCNLNRFPS